MNPAANAPVCARAHSNIALIKYWGKRDQQLKLPHNSSLSLTLDALYTDTEAVVALHLSQDQLELNGAPAPEKAAQRTRDFLNFLRRQLDASGYLYIRSQNSFPTAAGLASSASGFAALTLAATRALGFELSPPELSRLARQGSGSACRSLFGGFVLWQRGERIDGMDSYALPLNMGQDWDLRMVVAVLNPKEKSLSSGDGMAQTVATSPLYAGWLASVNQDLTLLQKSLTERDFTLLGRTLEHNALKMHATSLAAQPAVIYWQAESLALLQAIQTLRKNGVEAYCTLDAGPNLKIMVQPPQLQQLLDFLNHRQEIQQVIVCKPGPDAHIIPALVPHV